MMEAIDLILHTEEPAACTREQELFTEVEFEVAANIRDKKRKKAARICASCALSTQCPVRVNADPRRQRRHAVINSTQSESAA
jgi:predicted aldo/keto reductase-like oxidoreductase